MDSYLMMLYVTLEQESALKQFFLEHGWPYSKPDLSITTDKLGPANCNLVSSPVVLPQPASDKVEPTKSSQVPNTAPDIEPTSIKPGKRKAKPPPRYAVKEKQAKVATKQHSTRTSKQKDTMTYIDIDTAGPSNVFADPSNISAEPSDISADPSNTSSGPSNSAAGPSNIVAGPSKTAAKTVKILSITGLDGEETQVKIEVPDAEYEKESVDQDFDDNDIPYDDDDDDDDPDYNENDDDDGDDSDDDYSYKGQGQSVTSNTVKNSKSGADDTTSASKEQSVGTENSKKECKGSYRHYDLDQLTKAVKEEKMSTCKAARVFGVVRSTLHDRLTGRPPLFSHEQEVLLAGHLKTMKKIGSGYSQKETINLANDYAVQLGLRDPEHLLTGSWLYAFLNRWPELKVQKLLQSSEVGGAKSATRNAIDNYFKELEHIMTKYNLHDKPHRVYNIDEKALSPENKNTNVIGGRYSESGKVKTTTLIGCANGVGNAIPPYIIFPGARFSSNLLEGASAGADGCVTESGWSDSKVYEKYIKTHLIKYLPARDDEDVLVLYDRHKSRITLPLIEWAKSQRIHLFVLPPNCSHLLQSLDVSAFGPLQKSYKAASHPHAHESGVINMNNISSLACKVYNSILTPANVKKVFHESGIHPLDKTVISDSPATTFVVVYPPLNDAIISDTTAN